MIKREQKFGLLGVCCMCLSLATGCPVDSPPDAVDMGSSSMDDMGGVDVDMPDVDMDEQPDVLSISSVTPEQGVMSGGSEVLINGTAFEPGAKVFFGESEATDVDVRSQTQIKVTSPAAASAGVVDVIVENPDGTRVTKSSAFTYLEGAVETPLYCRLQAQSPYRATSGMSDAEQLYVVVFAEGKTAGEGAGSGVEAELGVGMGSDYESFAFEPMAYNVDKDGLTPGDLANDEYGALPPLDEPGEFSYLARVRVDGGDWLYCDLDGSDNGVSNEQLGQLVVEADAPVEYEVSYCQLMSADPVAVTTGQQSPELAVRVFSDQVTPGSGQGTALEGFLGYGASLDDLDALTYVPLNYQGDADGLSQGDLANDDYTATVLLDSAGEYRYVARFRVKDQEGSEWFYCDLDGHDESSPFETEQAGTLQVTDPAVPTLGFCQTETTLVKVAPGEQTTAITGLVYMQDVTTSAGQGTGITGELVWGARGTDPQTWTNSTAAAYVEDVDGLNAGDLANDRYSVTLTPAQEGSFDYAYRFSLDSGTSWVWCDTDGSGPDPTSFEDTKLGELEVESVNLPDSCRIQFPSIVQSAIVGQDVTVYGRVEEIGITDLVDDSADVSMELWVGPVGLDPEVDAAMFDKVSMVYNPAMPASVTEDEYVATWSPTSAGSYQFVLRASVDSGANYSFCDLDGDEFDALKVGVIQAFDSAPDLVDYCHVFQTQATWSLADPSLPIFTAEVYEGGVTEGNGGANSAQLEAEVGYGASGVNPALAGGYAWQPAPFSMVNPGNSNNYEYQGSPVDQASAPSQGTYGAVIRVRRAGQSDMEWMYCDSLSSSGDFLMDHISVFEVVP